MVEIFSDTLGDFEMANEDLRRVSALGDYRHSFSFAGYGVRVNGVVFTEWTEEFRDVICKEVIWAKLQQGKEQ